VRAVVSCATLRDAVTTANALTTSASSPAEIDLPSGTITLTDGILTLGSSTNLFVTVKGHTPGSPAGTVIDQTTANQGAFITPGSFANEVANFSDLTIEGGNAGGYGGGAIQAGAAATGATGNATTVTDCAFVNNTATKGGAITFASGGDLTITSSTFTSNSATDGTGGAVDFFTDGAHGASALTISGSTFTNNSITGIVNGGANGGGVFYSGATGSSLSITTSVFTGNSAGSSGGAAGEGGGLLISDANGNSDSVTLSTFVNNTAHDGSATNAIPQGQGGGVWTNGATLTLSDSRLVGNTATDGPSLWQDTNGGSATATNDWWGLNTGPGSQAGGGSGASVTTSPWLELRTIPAPATVLPGGYTTLTADLLGRNTGGALASGSLNGLAAFPASGVFSNAVDGTLSGASTQFVNGVATATLTAGTTLGTGAAHADATADSQTVTGNVNVMADSTTSVATSPATSVFGQSVTLTATVTSNTSGTTPAVPQGGTVQFKADGTAIGSPAAVTNGSASLSYAGLAVGNHSITAVYSGDADFNGSTSATGATQTVNKADTTAAISSSLNPAFAGQSVQFTVTLTAVSPGAGTPGGTGAVQFSVDSVPTGTAQTPVNGVASFTTSGLAVGSHVVTVLYAGDADFNGSSATLAPDQVINPAPTSLAVSSSQNPSVFGQGVRFSAAVSSPYAGTPGGSVQFGVDGSNAGAPQPLAGGTALSGTISDLAVGTHTVTATYLASDGLHAGSSGTLAGGQTVNKAATTTALGSDDNPSFGGAPVDFTATVTAVSPGGGTPTGTVQFVIDNANFGSPAGLTNGVATLSGVSTLSIGTHPVVADYLGDSDFTTSSSPTLSQVVNGFATTTTLTSAVDPSVFGQGVTFTATVGGGGNGTPTGTVQFGVDGANAGGPVFLSGGAATSATIASLAVGTHTVTATYAGAGSFAASAGTLAGGQTVDQAGTTTTVASSANPSMLGQPVTFTATVAAAAPAAGTPTGQVQFFVDGSAFGSPDTLTGGTATSGVDSSLAVGTHQVTATYTGDPDFTPSASATLDQVVGLVTPTVGVTSTANPSVFGQPVSFVATVTGGAGQPTGSVQFGADGANVGTPVTLAGGVATSTAISSLAVGVHTVTATYSGDGTYRAATGTLTQAVDAAASTVLVASSANPSVSGQPVHFTATVSAQAPGAGTPAGQVQFKIDGASAGSPVTLSGGVATSGDFSSLPVGNHTVEADYLGSGSFNATSGLLPGGQAVNKASTTTAVTSSLNPSVGGQAVTFTATVSPVAPGAGTPDGTVLFTIDGSASGSPVTLVDGVATLSTSSLAPGSHTVAAAYSGSASFTASSGTLPGGQSVATPAMADLQLQKNGPRQAVVGIPAVYLLAVANLGPDTATGVKVVDAVPPSFAVVKVIPSRGSCTKAGSKVTCSIGTLGAYETVSVVIIVLPSEAGTFTNSAAVSADQADPRPSNDVSSVTTRVHGLGYWLLGADGGVFTFGDAGFFGSTGGMQLNRPIVAMAPSADGLGYWLVGADGGVFTFGDAGYFGSEGGTQLPGPIVGIAAAPDGLGYWLVGSDGSVYPHGDAGSFGSLAGQHLNGAIVGMAPAPDGGGYWLAGADGGVYAFGDAGWFGSLGGLHLNGRIVALAVTPDGAGYWLVGSDGGVFAFGDARFIGGMGGQHLNKPVIGLSL
jgi:hypothetical protein